MKNKFLSFSVSSVTLATPGAGEREDQTSEVSGRIVKTLDPGFRRGDGKKSESGAGIQKGGIKARLNRKNFISLTQ